MAAPSTSQTAYPVPPNVVPLAVADGGTGAATAAAARASFKLNDTRLVGRGLIPGSGTFQTITNTAYWCYLGYTSDPILVKFIEFMVTTLATVNSVGEVVLASGDKPPWKGNVALTKLANSSDGTLDDLTANVGRVHRNTTAIGVAGAGVTVPTGTHLYAGIRFATGGNQPIVRGVSNDYGQGFVLSTATPGALTGAGPWTGVPITDGVISVGCDLSWTSQ